MLQIDGKLWIRIVKIYIRKERRKMTDSDGGERREGRRSYVWIDVKKLLLLSLTYRN